MTEIKRLNLALLVLHAVGVSSLAAVDQGEVLGPVQMQPWQQLLGYCLSA
jgi:hypothetical protein